MKEFVGRLTKKWKLGKETDHDGHDIWRKRDLTGSREGEHKQISW